MRIIFLNRFFFPDHSATSQMLSDLAFHLAGTGAEVEVITGRQIYDDPNARLEPEASVRGVRIHRVASSRFGRHILPGRALDYLSFAWSARRRLNGILRPGDRVVCMTDPPLLSVAVAPVCRRRGARLANWLQDLFPEVATAVSSERLRPLLDPLRRLRNTSLTGAVVNVVIGSGMARRLLDEGVPPGSLRTIANWAEIGPMLPAASRIRDEWGLAGRFVIGYSGNLGRAHDYRTILEAAHRLRHEPDVRFLLIGGGAMMAALRQEAQARGLQNLMFKPYQPRERLAESLAAADIHLAILRPELEGLIVPSKFYGIAAAGRPTLFVGDPDGEIPRLIAEAEAGVTVQVGDAEAMVRQILRLRSEPETRERMGRNARALLEARFTAAHAYAAWDSVLREERGPALGTRSTRP